MGQKTALRRFAGIGLAAALLGVPVAGCVIPTNPSIQPTAPRDQPGQLIDPARAGAIARDYFGSADAHGEGSMVFDVKVSTPVLGTSKLSRSVWKVQVEGDVSDPGKTTPAYHSVMWLEIDALNGQIVIVAQG